MLAIVIVQPWVNPKWMFFDALTAAEFSDDCCHIYYGFISNLGIFLWISTAAIALFSALIFFLNPRLKPFFGFALSSGLLSAWLGLDDAFLLHEVAFPELGVPQLFVLFIYVALAGVYGLISLRVIMSAEFWILVLAAIGVGTSLGLDTLLHSIEDNIVIMEDSAKFFGIFSWFTFHAVTLARIFLTKYSDPAARLNSSG
ncbi:hypothetical protein [Robiginitomaculum antarcticum]|uniref:hypothetical protein n=1 Tax=Robiginitomaculum antarcticum TaxID=437507 RepID=UPI0012E9D5F3|nr:hypothetical protein [Robiginitomaculum antarcticum]